MASTLRAEFEATATELRTQAPVYECIKRNEKGTGHRVRGPEKRSNITKRNDNVFVKGTLGRVGFIRGGDRATCAS
eukprot:3331092-Pyramimonas_sp.AAC.1